MMGIGNLWTFKYNYASYHYEIIKLHLHSKYLTMVFLGGITLSLLCHEQKLCPNGILLLLKDILNLRPTAITMALFWTLF